MRTRKKRRKGFYVRRIIGKNCRFLSYDGGVGWCALSGRKCCKSRKCGYEEESRTIDRLKEIL